MNVKAWDLPKWLIEQAKHARPRRSTATAPRRWSPRSATASSGSLRELEKLALEHGPGATIGADEVEESCATSRRAQGLDARRRARRRRPQDLARAAARAAPAGRARHRPDLQHGPAPARRGRGRRGAAAGPDPRPRSRRRCGCRRGPRTSSSRTSQARDVESLRARAGGDGRPRGREPRRRRRASARTPRRSGRSSSPRARSARIRAPCRSRTRIPRSSRRSRRSRTTASCRTARRARSSPPAARSSGCACPRYDGPSVFGALLDRDAGTFRLGPADTMVPAARRYLPGTMILETSWGTSRGWVIVRDVLLDRPVARHRRALEHAPPRAHRLRRRPRPAAHDPLRQRHVEVQLECDPIFDYGRRYAHWEYAGERLQRGGRDRRGLADQAAR